MLIIEVDQSKNTLKIEVNGTIKELAGDLAIALTRLIKDLDEKYSDKKHSDFIKDIIIGVMRGEHLKDKLDNFEYPKQPKDWSYEDDLAVRLGSILLSEVVLSDWKNSGLTKEEFIKKTVGSELYATHKIGKGKKLKEKNDFGVYMMLKTILKI